MTTRDVFLKAIPTQRAKPYKDLYYLQAQEHYVGRVAERTRFFNVQQSFRRFFLNVQVVVAKILNRFHVLGLVSEFGQERLKLNQYDR